jgi:6-phosphogluconolactonase
VFSYGHLICRLCLIVLLCLLCTSVAIGQAYIGYVGTYTHTGSEGIYTFRFNAKTGEISGLELAAKTNDPSFLVIDNQARFLYSVNELNNFANQRTGAISVFAIERGSGRLDFRQQIASLGADPAHLSLDRSNRYLLVANYTSGNVAVFPIGQDGQLGPRSALIQDSGSSVNKERQQGPHAHSIQTTADNRFVLVTDLGIDKVLVYRFDSRIGSLSEPQFVTLEPGAGPRHLAFASDRFVYVLNELKSAISVFTFDSVSGALSLKQTISTLPQSFSGDNTAAEITVDSKNRFLYVSNRGDDAIVQFRIDPANGRLVKVARFSTGGKAPRHFEIDPSGRWLLVANQNSNDIRVFRISSRDGKLIPMPESLKILSPVCIRFLTSSVPS